MLLIIFTVQFLVVQNSTRHFNVIWTWLISIKLASLTTDWETLKIFLDSTAYIHRVAMAIIGGNSGRSWGQTHLILSSKTSHRPSFAWPNFFLDFIHYACLRLTPLPISGNVPLSRTKKFFFDFQLYFWRVWFYVWLVIEDDTITKV